LEPWIGARDAMFRPLHHILDRTLATGHLIVVAADGRTYEFGDRRAAPVIVRIADNRTERHLTFNPTLALGEAYANGRCTVEPGTIYDLLEVVAVDLDWEAWPGWMHALDYLRFLTRRLRQFNPKTRSKRNVAHHYDLDEKLYDLFLAADRQYSCAYFEEDGISLDEAQNAKKHHLAAKLDLRDGLKILDIGSGWGGLALYLAKTAHVTVTGITLSESQLKISRERAAAMGLAKAVNFELCDYRDLDGQFDRIVSVGMFEHVGLSHYGSFFNRITRLLEPDGVALLHSIGRSDGPGAMNPFITKYIFPGTYVPALSEVLPVVESEGLLVADIEILRLHYAMTLRHWRQRLRANWNAAVAMFGDRFCRMWEYYFAICEIGFRHQNLMVFQMQLAKDQAALPLTRNYMYEGERELRLRESHQCASGAGTIR
jgi:cyclopropane-fatty-acyl-phospholipid synthase